MSDKPTHVMIDRETLEVLVDVASTAMSVDVEGDGYCIEVSEAITTALAVLA